MFDKSKLIIHAGDIVVGKHFEEGWVRTESIPAIRLKVIVLFGVGSYVLIMVLLDDLEKHRMM